MHKLSLCAALPIALIGCEGDLREEGRQGNSREPETIAEILEAGLRNPQLTAALNRRLNQLDDAQARAAELTAAGFLPNDTEQPCTAYAFRGEPRTSWGRDDTLEVRLTECSSLGESRRELVVNFGDAGG